MPSLNMASSFDVIYPKYVEHETHSYPSSMFVVSFLPWQLAYITTLISSVNEANAKSKGLVGISSIKVFKFSPDLNGVLQEETLRFPHISHISSFYLDWLCPWWLYTS